MRFLCFYVFMMYMCIDTDGVVAHLDIKMNNTVKRIYDVVATIKGKKEKDREVIMGAHRDAWVFGATDPHTYVDNTLKTGH